jgi:hypothetical protein
MPQLSAKVERQFSIPGDPDKASLKIRHLKPGEIQRIESDTTEWLGKSSGDGGTFSTELKFNPTAQLRALRVASVVGWKGFRGLSDEPLECNRANLGLYLDEDPVLGEGEEAQPLSAWIDKFRKTLSDELVAQEEEETKN